MDEKIYLIDGRPSSARDIILAAQALDPEYRRDGFCHTSTAADILREHGHCVEEAYLMYRVVDYEVAQEVAERERLA